MTGSGRRGARAVGAIASHPLGEQPSAIGAALLAAAVQRTCALLFQWAARPSLRQSVSQSGMLRSGQSELSPPMGDWQACPGRTNTAGLLLGPPTGLCDVDVQLARTNSAPSRCSCTKRTPIEFDAYIRPANIYVHCSIQLAKYNITRISPFHQILPILLSYLRN